MSLSTDLISFGRECTTELLQKYGSLPLLTHKEEIDYGQLVKRGDEIARRKLVEHNIRLVVKIAAKFTGYGVEMDDLVNEGLIGLITAINKFEPKLGNRFSTYATYWIRQAVQRAAAAKGTLMRVPIHVHDLRYKIARAANDFLAEHHREPSADEVAKITGLQLDKIEACIDFCRGVSSLDEKIGDDEDTSLGSLIAVNQETPDENTLDELKKLEISKILDTLQEREAFVIRSRFGIDGMPTKSLEQIGQALGVTRERVRQIEKRAMKILSKHPRFIALVA